jgi:hypothetical protein
VRDCPALARDHSSTRIPSSASFRATSRDPKPHNLAGCARFSPLSTLRMLAAGGMKRGQLEDLQTQASVFHGMGLLLADRGEVSEGISYMRACSVVLLPCSALRPREAASLPR